MGRYRDAMEQELRLQGYSERTCTPPLGRLILPEQLYFASS